MVTRPRRVRKNIEEISHQSMLTNSVLSNLTRVLWGRKTCLSKDGQKFGKRQKGINTI
jgi:hypothetical protein